MLELSEAVDPPTLNSVASGMLSFVHAWSRLEPLADPIVNVSPGHGDEHGSGVGQ